MQSRYLKSNRKHKKGFTLVEIIVVLVILAILAAILVPTMIKYIDKANKKAAIAECRQVVLAAQGTASEMYGEKDFSIRALNTPATKNEILTLADTKGKFQEDVNASDAAKILYLKYECENGTVVIYDVTENPPYIIYEKPSYLTILNEYVKNANDWTHAYMDANKKDNPDRKETIEEFKKQNNGKLPEVTDEEKAGTAFENKSLYWKPYYIGSGQNSVSILFANSNDTGHGGWTGNLIYMDGVIYEAKNPSSNNISSIYKDNKSYDDVQKWLEAHQYEPVKK